MNMPLATLLRSFFYKNSLVEKEAILRLWCRRIINSIEDSMRYGTTIKESEVVVENAIKQLQDIRKEASVEEDEIICKRITQFENETDILLKKIAV